MEQTANGFSVLSLDEANEDEVGDQTFRPQTTTMTSPAERKTKPTTFLDLPGELRNGIYKLAVPSGRKVDMRTKNLPWKLLGINVTGARDQIGIGASVVFFRSNTFHATSYDEAFRFLMSIDLGRRCMIRRLELEYLAHRELPHGIKVRRTPNSDKTMFAVNQLLSARNIRGVRPSAVFVPGESEADWVCLTEVPDVEIVGIMEGWEVRRKRAE